MPKKVPAVKTVSKTALKVKKISKAKKDNKKNEKKSKIIPKNKIVNGNTKRNGKINNEEILELGLLLDCSGSMRIWIDRAK